MKQQFKGYLEARLREITGLKTGSLRRLVAYALDGHLEISPELLLLALERGQYVYFMSLCWATPLEDRYRAITPVLYGVNSIEEFLASPDTPHQIKRVHQAYLESQLDPNADDVSIERLRARTVRAIERSGITRYSVCKELKLNAGNVYAYLNGDVSKVSLETAQRICDYVYERASNKA